MQGLGVEESSEVLVVEQPAGESHAASSKASREEPPRNGAGLPSEREAKLDNHQSTVDAQFATSVSAGRPEVDPER